MNFLGISKSYTNKEWVGPSEQNLQQALAYSKSLSIPHLSALQLIKNKINEGDYLDYISPKIKNLIPSPKIFLDMEKGSLRLRRALEQKESVAIFADYDVDGTVSAALISLWLRNFSIEPTVYIPDRETEGFGPNIDAMNKLALNHTLIICVDCGTDSEEAIRGATERGVDVIVIDHHKSDTFSKSAYAIINPNRFDEKNIFPYLCAAGVVFIFLVEMNRIIPKSRSSEINLLSYLNLVSLATIADVVPLIGLNRAFVKQGLKIFQNRLCLKMFGTHFNLLQNFNEETIAFQVAPRLNASGRIDTAYLTYQFLTATDPKSIEIYLNNDNFLFNWEWTQMEQTAGRLIRSAGSWYEHSWVVDGYTNNGEVLGSSIGPGSNSHYFSINRIRNQELIGIGLEIVDNDNDFYYEAFAQARDFRRYWKDLNFHLNYDILLNNLKLSSTLVYIKSFNYQWELDDYATPYYHPGRDIDNFHLSLKLTYFGNW